MVGRFSLFIMKIRVSYTADVGQKPHVVVGNELCDHCTPVAPHCPKFMAKPACLNYVYGTKCVLPSPTS